PNDIKTRRFVYRPAAAAVQPRARRDRGGADCARIASPTLANNVRTEGETGRPVLVIAISSREIAGSVIGIETSPGYWNRTSKYDGTIATPSPWAASETAVANSVGSYS